MGEQFWIDQQEPLDYTIRFENDAELATAPAQMVRIVQTLDSDLDWTSFRLGDFGFGSVYVSVPDDTAFYQTRLDVTETLGVYVDVRAGIEIRTGEVFWELTAIDPATGDLPENPLVGFLPPNIEPPEGDGFVTYTVWLNEGLPTSTVIDAEARIFFDYNDPIDTPPIFNTIDAGSPTSWVEPLPTVVSTPNFLVTWDGHDDEGGSGIARYDIYVSTDDGPFSRWLVGTTETSAVFAGDVGFSYGFYSVAIDGVGHWEVRPVVADTQTTVIEPDPVSVVGITTRNAPTTRIDIRFEDSVTIAAMIDDGSIVSAVELHSLAMGAIALTPEQFSYDDATHTLSIVLDTPLPDGFYEVRLDGARITASDGAVLRGGRSGLLFEMGTFGAAQFIQAGSSDLQVGAYSVPSLADWNGDGLIDLVVSEKTLDSTGKVRVYLNQGTNQVPTFDAFTYAQTLDGDLAVPASGCLGVFARVHDWNGDGKKDLVLGLANGQVQVALNENTDNEPRFGLPSYVQVGQPGSKTNLDVGDRATLEMVDWNNDGLADLLVGSLDGRIRLYLNEGTSHEPDFRMEQVLLSGSSDLVLSAGRASVAVADLNADGRKDLVIGDTDGRLRLYPNIGTDFAPVFDGWLPIVSDGVAIDLPGTPRSRPFVSDYDNDGILDLLVGAEDGRVRLYTGLTPGEPTELPSPVPGAPAGLFVHTFAFPWYSDSAPVIEALAVSPRFVSPSATVRLTANGVSDPDGSVVRVEFYRDNNDNGLWEVGADEYLGADEDGGNGWSLSSSTATWALGAHTLFARAVDNDGQWSNVVWSTAIVRPSTVRDLSPPVASLNVADVTAAGGSTQEFTVRFTDATAINVATLRDGNLCVRGPGMFQQQATLVSVSHSTHGAERTATYQITAPGGSWYAADSGHYEIWMLPLQVADLDRNYVRLGRLGTFAVTIDPSQVGEVPDEPAGAVTDDRLEIVHGQLRLRSGRTLATIGAPMVNVVIAVPDTSSPENENPMEIALGVQTTAWRNSLDQYDVTGEGLVSPLDALTVITELNTAGGRSLPLLPEGVTITAPFYDVSGDYQLSPLDALLVITRLNRPPESEGEAEGEAEPVTVAEMALVDSQLATIRDDARLWLQPPAAEETRSRFAAHLRDSLSSRRDQSPDRSLVELEPANPQVKTGLRGWDRVWGSKKAAGDESDVEVLLSEIADDIASAWSHWS